MNRISLWRSVLPVVLFALFVTFPLHAQWVAGASGIYYNGHIANGTPGGDASSIYSFYVAETAPNFALYATSTTAAAYATFVSSSGAACYFGQENSAGNRILDSGGLPYALAFQAAATRPIQFGAGGAVRVTVLPSGNIGIGTTAPAAKLDVNGSVNVSGNIAAKYQDVAEWVTATEPLETGMVVVLNTRSVNEVTASSVAYDTTVAGVVSATPGLILGTSGDSKEKIATTGRVKVRVDASGAPIKIGDLLVTSDTRGYAMKSVPIEVGGAQIHRPGTIIGKALEPLSSGTGEILVLLSLQ